MTDKKADTVADRDAKRAAESKQALENAAQSEGLLRSSLASQAKRVSDHMSAKNTGSVDQVEIWATRVGRLLGVLGLIGLTIYLVATYVV